MRSQGRPKTPYPTKTDLNIKLKEVRRALVVLGEDLKRDELNLAAGQVNVVSSNLTKLLGAIEERRQNVSEDTSEDDQTVQVR